MNWSKQKESLLSLLEDLNSRPEPSQKQEDIENYLIKWMKIRKICKQRLEDQNLSAEERNIPSGLLKKFKLNVQPRLLNFAKDMKKKRFDIKLNNFISSLMDYFSKGEKYLHVYPMKSYEIYEDSLFFINLYRFAFKDDSLIRSAKKIAIKKLKLIKQSFEVEAGKENLEEEQKQLSAGLRNSLKGSSPNVPKAKTKTKIKIKTKTKTSEITPKPESIVDSKSGYEDDLLLGELKLPDEEDISFVEEEKDIEQKIEKTETVLKSELKIPIYGYSNWFPVQIWNDYSTYRYCLNCGRKIDPFNRICTGCNKKIPQKYLV